MNDEQKNKLAVMLDRIVNAQRTVSQEVAEGSFDAIRKAEDKREFAIDKVISFVDSFVVGELDTTDPRAGLRRCIVDGDDSEVYFYHGCYTDANREECAKLEYQDGRTREAYWVDIRFVDVAEEQCQPQDS